MTFSTFEIYYLRTTLCGDSLHLHGIRKIGGVYGRYWGSREIFAEIIIYF